MGASAVPALLDWLTSFLKLNLENNSVDVSEGWPGDKITRTTLVIGDVLMEHEQTHLGGHRRSEDAVVECWILVDKPGGTATEVRAEAYRILDVVDTNIRTSGHRDMWDQVEEIHPSILVQLTNTAKPFRTHQSAS